MHPLSSLEKKRGDERGRGGEGERGRVVTDLLVGPPGFTFDIRTPTASFGEKSVTPNPGSDSSFVIRINRTSNAGVSCSNPASSALNPSRYRDGSAAPAAAAPAAAAPAPVDGEVGSLLPPPAAVAAVAAIAAVPPPGEDEGDCGDPALLALLPPPPLPPVLLLLLLLLRVALLPRPAAAQAATTAPFPSVLLVRPPPANNGYFEEDGGDDDDDDDVAGLAGDDAVEGFRCPDAAACLPALLELLLLLPSLPPVPRTPPPTPSAAAADCHNPAAVDRGLIAAAAPASAAAAPAAGGLPSPSLLLQPLNIPPSLL